MKNPLILLFALVLTSLLISCGSDADVRENAANAVGGSTSTESPLAPAPPLDPVTATAPTGGVQHYTCPNNCAGSGGPSQGNCPVCGTAYQHNQAWHNQQQPAAANPITTTPQQDANPAQNAAGVWHYTCSNGCSGGAGSAGNCASCGSPLAHNTAYHN